MRSSSNSDSADAEFEDDDAEEEEEAVSFSRWEKYSGLMTGWPMVRCSVNRANICGLRTFHDCGLMFSFDCWESSAYLTIVMKSKPNRIEEMALSFIDRSFIANSDL